MDKKIIGDVSLESIVNALFSKEEDGSSGDPAPDETVITLDPEVLEELTEEEGEIVEIPTDPDDIIETDSEIAEESARLGCEVQTMELAMRTAEEYMWKSSFEAETIDPSILKKFWEWLKKIVAKIKEFLLTAFKRVQIWLSGDMKAKVKWATDNKADIEKAISAKGDVTLKIKKPVKNPSEISFADLASVKKASDAVSKGESDDALVAEMKKISEKTVKSVVEEIYGKDAKSADVKLSDFDKAVGGIFTVLTNAAAIKNSASKINDIVKSASDAAKAYDKVSSAKEIEKAKLSGVKTLASATQKAISVASSVAYWKIAAMISIVKISEAYAKKALKANKAAA